MTLETLQQSQGPLALPVPEVASPGSSYTLVKDPEIPRLLGKIEEHVRTGFQDTRVLEAQPDFIKEVVKVPFQLILTHSCVVLGAAGAGKTTLVKALGGGTFEPHVPAGPHLKNRTQHAQWFDLELEGLIEDLQFGLIDTPGWSPETSTDIKSQYKLILKEKQLVSEQTPHIIMFCVPVSSIRQFEKDEARKMSKQLQDLKFDRRFPIKVLPVATKADTEDPHDLPDLLSTIGELTRTAFQDTGAEVQEPLSTQLPPRGQLGVDLLKERLERVLHSQLHSSEFCDLWQKAFAKSVAAKTKEHCERFPENDSALRLFKRACHTVASACGKQVEGLDDVTMKEELCWSEIERIPTTEGQPWRPPSKSLIVRCWYWIGPRARLGCKAMLVVLAILAMFRLHKRLQAQQEKWNEKIVKVLRRLSEEESAHKITQEGLDAMTQKHQAEQSAHKITREGLDAMTQKYQAEQSAHKITWEGLDAMTQKYQAEQSAHKITREGLDAMTQKYQAEQSAHKITREGLGAMTWKHETLLGVLRHRFPEFYAMYFHAFSVRT